MKFPALIFAIGFCVTLMSSCAPVSSKSAQMEVPEAPLVEAEPEPEGPFLATSHPDLEAWLEERFKIRYENMPIDQVFEQDPISKIRYQKVNMPADAPLFMLVSPSISRREILEEIAMYYGLDMKVEMSDGQPSHVLVNGLPPGREVPPTQLIPTRGMPSTASGNSRDGGVPAYLQADAPPYIDQPER